MLDVDLFGFRIRRLLLANPANAGAEVENVSGPWWQGAGKGKGGAAQLVACAGWTLPRFRHCLPCNSQAQRRSACYYDT